MGYKQIPALGGGGGGAVDSVNGLTGVVVLTKSNIGLSNVNNTSDANKPVSTATQAALDLKQDILSGSFNSFAGFDGSGAPFSIPGWGFYSDLGGYSVNLTQDPDSGDTGQSVNTMSVENLPTEDSPDASFNIYNNYINHDNAAFDFGTNGNAYRFTNNFIEARNDKDLGDINFVTNNFTLGNGTDAINVKGFSYALGFGSISGLVTINGPMQGYMFQPNFQAGALVTNFLNAFGDYTNSVDTIFEGYNSASFTPNLAGIKNNNNYTGLNIAPSIEDFQGNSGFFGINVTPNLGTFGTGGFFGVNINPQSVDDVDNATGLYINMNNVTASGTKRAIEAVGDVSITGALSFSGALSIGQLNAFYGTNPFDGGGNPSTLHSLITSVTALNGTTTANADMIGVNTSMLMTMEANAICTSGPFGLGFAPLALPCVVETHTGSNLEHANAAVYAINLVGSSTGGTIQNVNLCRAVAIPNGITTVNKLKGFLFQLPFGDVGTQIWGSYMEPASAQNWFAGPIKQGGTGGSTDVVTNDSVGFELDSKALLLARMNTAARDALTAVNGMLIYNSQTNKFQGYENGAWADLI